MTLIHYRPWNKLNDFQELLNQMLNFNEQKNDVSTVETSRWVPTVDIKEEKDCFILWADVPGVSPEKIDVSMENNILTIKGERKEVHQEEKENYSRLERVEGSFYRRFTLPDTADGDNISAKTKHGVLEIVIPKKKAQTSKKIVIEVEKEAK